jgi:CheY-like chemotaxis protein
MSEQVDVLLVEDNPHDAELALHAFHKHADGAKVQLVREGAEALEFLACTGRYAQRDAQQAPRLILLDLKLPFADGHYVLRQIRSNPQTKATPVVVLSSSREPRDIFQSYQLGVNSYIVKPVDYEEFSDMIRTLTKYWLAFNQPLVS